MLQTILLRRAMRRIVDAHLYSMRLAAPQQMSSILIWTRAAILGVACEGALVWVCNEPLLGFFAASCSSHFSIRFNMIAGRTSRI